MTLKFELEGALENRFREAAMRKYGYMKGSLKKATEEALSSWVMQSSDSVPKSDNPVKLVRGILSHLKGKKSAVQLQHEVGRLWAKRYL